MEIKHHFENGWRQLNKESLAWMEIISGKMKSENNGNSFLEISMEISVEE